MKLDGRNQATGKAEESGMLRTPRSRGIGKNELKNLQSELNEYVEGVRSRGEALSPTYQ